MIMTWCCLTEPPFLRRPKLLSYLHGLPLAPLGGVLHLGAGVEAGEGGEGVDARPAGAREGAHEAADAAQRGENVRRERRVHQQLRHQTPSLIYHREIHTVPTGRALQAQHTPSPTAAQRYNFSTHTVCCGT